MLPWLLFMHGTSVQSVQRFLAGLNKLRLSTLVIKLPAAETQGLSEGEGDENWDHGEKDKGKIKVLFGICNSLLSKMQDL